MTEKPWKMLIFSYLKMHGRILMCLFLVAGIFGSMFLLYGLPAEPYFYGITISSVCIAIIGGNGWRKYWQRYRKLEQISEGVSVALERLPEPRDEVEELYQDMLHQLCSDFYSLDARSRKNRQEMLEYYTLWVHQIKTPIAAMRLLLQLPGVPEKAHRTFSKPKGEELSGESHLALSMELFQIEQYVDMALNYVRTDYMEQDMVIREYSLDGLIRQVIRKYARMFILKKLALNYEGVETTVLTDEKWLVFVLEQLLSNALKYTNEGSISVYMGDHSGDSHKKILVIEDTGIGINPEDLPRIFHKGFTGYNGRNHKRSTGIGLYLSRIILKRLHHDIQITSRLGVGTRVELDLSSCHLDMID